MLVDFDPGESARLISRWLQFFELRKFSRSEEISSLARREADLLFVSSGAIGLFSSVSGERQLIGIVQRGGSLGFGGRGLAEGKLGARALKNSNIYIGRTSQLRPMMPENAFNEMLLSATRHTFNLILNQTVAMKARRLDDRIMIVLRNCGRFLGEDMTQSRISVDWGISQAEFASLLGVARPYLNKTMRLLEEAGRIRIDGDHLELQLD